MKTTLLLVSLSFLIGVVIGVGIFQFYAYLNLITKKQIQFLKKFKNRVEYLLSLNEKELAKKIIRRVSFILRSFPSTVFTEDFFSGVRSLVASEEAMNYYPTSENENFSYYPPLREDDCIPLPDKISEELYRVFGLSVDPE